MTIAAVKSKRQTGNAMPDTAATATLAQARASTPRWFAAYALLGFVQSGVAPILLPLSAGNGANGGMIYAAWAAAGLTAPLLGAWADRRRAHRALLVFGLALGAVAMLGLAATTGLWPHVALAFAGGLGCVAASIVGTMLIVGNCPAEVWDEEIGTLQAWISGGQVAGLLAAGALAATPRPAFLGAAALLALAVPVARLFAPGDPAPVERREVKPRAPIGGEAANAGASRVHHVSWRGIAALSWFPHGPLRRFLLVWLVSYTATNAVATMFPVAMTHQFGAPAILPSAAYAVGILASLLLYRPAARFEHRRSPLALLRAGFVGRGVVLVAMAVLAWQGARQGAGWATWAVLAGFALSQVIWPLLAVSSTTLAVTLANTDRGESVGLLNACTSLGSTIGAIVGGQINREAGYGALCAVAVAAVLAALLLSRQPRGE